MRVETHPVRAAGLAATTLMALVAVSATVASAPAPRGLIAQSSSDHVVRAVAAAVAAAARDLLGAERSTAPLAALDPSFGEGAPCGLAAQPAGMCGPVALLGERLLDLPPPTC